MSKRISPHAYFENLLETLPLPDKGDAFTYKATEYSEPEQKTVICYNDIAEALLSQAFEQMKPLYPEFCARHYGPHSFHRPGPAMGKLYERVLAKLQADFPLPEGSVARQHYTHGDWVENFYYCEIGTIGEGQGDIVAILSALQFDRIGGVLEVNGFIDHDFETPGSSPTITYEVWEGTDMAELALYTASKLVWCDARYGVDAFYHNAEAKCYFHLYTDGESGTWSTYCYFYK